MSIFSIVERKTGGGHPADRAAIKIFVTAFLSTSYLSEGQFYRTEICDHSGYWIETACNWRDPQTASASRTALPA